MPGGVFPSENRDDPLDTPYCPAASTVRRSAPAARSELRDPSSRLLGWVAPRPGGVLEARDRAGRLLGTYDPAGNETRDRTGRLLYRGEALSALIVCHGGG